MTTPTMGPAARSILVLSAGLSTPSSTRLLADQLSDAARRELAEHPDGADVEVTTIELREIARDITDALLSRVLSPRLAALSDAIRRADAVIAVTPIFNTGPSGLFKSLLDALDPEVWRAKPVLLGATAGTARHSLAIEYAIRPIFVYLRAQIVPTAVFAASAEFGAATVQEADGAPLGVRARRAARELAIILRDAQREAEPPTDDAQPSQESAPAALDPEFSEFVPMDTLLRGR